MTSGGITKIQMMDDNVACKMELARRQSWAVRGLVGHKGLSQEQQEAFSQGNN